MTDVLAVSIACATAINRVIYQDLAARGWDIELVVPTEIRGKDFQRRSDPRGPGDPPLHTLDLSRSNQRLLRFRGLRALLEARRPRIVLLEFDPGSVVVLQVCRWARKRGARVVCQTNENLQRSPWGGLRRGRYRRALRDVGIVALQALVRRRIDHVLVISADGRQVMEAAGFAGRVTQIPLGFDPRLFVPDAAIRATTRQALGLEAFTFAYFGRLIEQKGVHLLLQALGQLRHERWHLLLDRFGEYRDPYAERIEALAHELGIFERIVFFDAAHAEMPRYMNAADAVAMPSISDDSWKEQYGRVAPEAMACGRLVIASASGALVELVGDAGVLVPEGDVEALAGALEQAVRDPAQARRRGQRASERAHAELGVPRQGAIMDALFRRWGAPSQPGPSPAP